MVKLKNKWQFTVLFTTRQTNKKTKSRLARACAFGDVHRYYSFCRFHGCVILVSLGQPPVRRWSVDAGWIATTSRTVAINQIGLILTGDVCLSWIVGMLRENVLLTDKRIFLGFEAQKQKNYLSWSKFFKCLCFFWSLV